MCVEGEAQPIPSPQSQQQVHPCLTGTLIQVLAYTQPLPSGPMLVQSRPAPLG